MKATDVLKQEHKLVLEVLKAAERESQQIRSTGRVDEEPIRQMIDFFRGFVDGCHHAKEERRLFPMLEDRGLPSEGGPVAVMLAEHDEGRGYTAAIEDCLNRALEGEPEAASALADVLDSYTSLLRHHISKEDNILFAMADARLSDEDQQNLITAFDELESEEVGPGVHERYHELVHQLAGH